ncbi:hypothetical protein PG994_000720 [Apiospora phragmitis]|uniref:Uncharacterized protein n=1 Tax=Apiospora phragmitis TaxID=2905665 RepID=A0ABR1X6Z6_9PEZI
MVIVGWTTDGGDFVFMRATNNTLEAKKLVAQSDPGTAKAGKVRTTVGSEVVFSYDLAHRGITDQVSYIPLIECCDERSFKRAYNYLSCSHTIAYTNCSSLKSAQHQEYVLQHVNVCLQDCALPKMMASCDIISTKHPTRQVLDRCYAKVSSCPKWKVGTDKDTNKKPFRTVRCFNRYDILGHLEVILEEVRKALAKPDILPIELLKLELLNIRMLWGEGKRDKANISSFLTYFVDNIQRTLSDGKAAFADLVSVEKGCSVLNVAVWGDDITKIEPLPIEIEILT